MPNSNKTLIRVKRNFQVTLPGNLRKKINISEGDYMDIEIKNNGLFIKPVKSINSDQEYFFTKEWQKDEKEADEDIKNGKLSGPFSSSKELMKHLKN